MAPTCGAGVTAAAGTGLAHHLFSKLLTLGKSLLLNRHLEFPYHTFVHCKVFATAASLRTRTSVSVSFSRLGLSSPLLIVVLVSHYLTNKLISHRLILWRRIFRRKHIPVGFFYSVLPSVSRVYSEP